MTNGQQPSFLLNSKSSTTATHHLCQPTNPQHTQPFR